MHKMTTRPPEKSKPDVEVFGAKGTISGQGRSGGGLAREIATEDELKRCFERPAGSTWVTKSKERKKK